MDNKKFNFFAAFIVLIVILLGVFVMASLAVTNIHAENNVTAQYDEGNFSINWTNATGDINYTIYVYVDDVYAYANVSGNDSGYTSGLAGFMYNNWTQGNYTFTIEALNETGSTGYVNSTNISMYIDRTAPVIDLRNSDGTQFSNATYRQQNTTSLTLNISVIDALSGMTGSVCLIDINGTNQTVPISSQWCNSTLINLTGTADGNRTIKVYVNDTVNIVGLNNSFVVFVDSTNPSVTTSCTPSSPTDNGEQVTCVCNGDDGSGTGIASETADSITTTSVAGLFTYDCSVSDNVGNSASATATYTVSGGGGGFSSGSTGTTKSNVFTKITPGAASIMKNFDAEFGVKQIKIAVNNEAQNVKVSVTKYDSKPAEVSVSKSGKVNKYLQIEATNLADKLDKATIQFKVGKSWISSNGLDADKIALFKFNEVSEEWGELITGHVGTEGDDEIYEVELDSFSYFAISEALSTGDEEGTTIDTGTERTDKIKGSIWWKVLIIFLVVLAVYFILNKKKNLNSSK